MAGAEVAAIAAFVVVYVFFGVYAATAATMIAGVLHAAWTWHRAGKVETFHLASLALLLVFGGLTLLLHDDRFIKLKPTVVYFSLALAFLVSHFVGDRLLVQRFFERPEVMIKNRRVWIVSNIAWTIGLVGLGILNFILALNLDTTTWVYFKLLGITSLLGVGVCVQLAYLQAHNETPPELSYNELRKRMLDEVGVGPAGDGSPGHVNVAV